MKFLSSDEEGAGRPWHVVAEHFVNLLAVNNSHQVLVESKIFTAIITFGSNKGIIR